MRKHLFFALALLIAVTVQAQTYWNGTSNKVFSGSGTEADPYQISTPEQLAGLAERVNNKEDFAGKFIKLMSDLYMSDPNAAKEDKHEWVPIGKMTITQDPLDQWSMTFDTCYFRGTFDGNGHTIHHLYMGTVGEVSFGSLDDPTQEDVLDFSGTDNSFFGYIDGGSVRNLTISDLGLAATGNMGGLAAVVRNGKIENVHVKDSRIIQSNVLAYACGGLIGSVSNTIVENSSVENTVIQAVSATGFAGELGNNAIVRHCHASGYVYATNRNVAVNDNNGSAAGFCFSVDEGCLIENCYSTVHVNMAGGPISTIYNAKWTGGFVNANNGGIIRNCYSTGNCTGANAAGFCVRNTGIIESCYAMGNVFSGELDNPAAFIWENGYENFIQYVGTVSVHPGIVRNCFSTGTCYEGEQPLTCCGFVSSALENHSSSGGMDSDGSQNVSCWFNNGNIPAAPAGTSKYTFGTIGCTTAFMQSQAFVDTLNIVAALFGLNKWQYNAGAYPTLTSEKATSTAVFGGGNGTKERPWLIDNMQHLKNLRALVNIGMDFRGLYVKQTADIELNAPFAQWGVQMPEQWMPIGNTRLEPKFNYTHQYTFRGTYNGDFHEVKNMYISNMKADQAFFGYVGRGAVVQNLGVTDAYIMQDGSVPSAAILIGGFPRYDGDITISQCWTSGSVDYIFASANEFAAGALVAGLPLEGNVRMLNCSSSASLHAYGASWAAAPDLYHVGIGQNDSVYNFLYTGQGGLVPNSGEAYNTNAFYDWEVYAAHSTEKEAYANYGRKTAYLKGAEFVNILNAAVDEWNAKNDFQLDYWQQVEGEYPKVTPNFQPPHKVTYDSKGGSSVAAVRVVDNSYILPPAKPTKEGFIFAGWYSDAACTQFFDYDNTPITGNITLYAKWLTPTYGTYDLSPFNNTFATEYHITNKAQLIGFVKAVNGIPGVRSASTFEGKTVYLDADILLNDTADWQHWGRFAYAESWEPIGSEVAKFMGRFEGQGHIISGLYYDSDDYARPALFGYVYRANKEDVAIRQLGIQASVVKANNSGALFVGCLREGTIEQCFASGKVIDYYQGSDGYGVGGFAANVGGWYAGDYGGQIKDCYSRVDVYANYILRDERSDLNVAWQSFVSGSSGASFVSCYAAGKAHSAGFPTGNGNTSTDCFYNKELLSATAVQGGTAKSTNEMHAIYTYSNWDFENVWGRNESINAGYPYLRCFVSNPPANDPDPIIVKDITLEETTLSLIAGDNVQLHASIVPENALNRKIHWTSNKTNFATVDENGMVRTIADLTKHTTETVIVTATTDEGAYTKKCTLTISYPNLILSQAVHARRIGETTWGTKPNVNELVVGYEYSFYAYSSPSEAHVPVSWTSSDKTLMTVEKGTDNTTYSGYTASGGYAAILNEGTVTLTATDERGLTATRTLTLKRYELAGIALTGSTITMDIGDTQELSAQLNPTYASEIPPMVWTSSAPNIVSVNENGVIEALNAGSATITVTCGTFTASRNVTVNAILPTSISLNETSIELPVGQTFQLVATILPENATNKSVTWSSSSTSNATVDENGLVTAVKKRSMSVTITAKTSNNKTATCTVKVVSASATQYTIRFLNWDGSVLQSSRVAQGSIPSYTGETPTRPEDDQYTYTFSGWSPTVVAATADADYTAQFDATKKPVTPPEPTYYTIRFLNWDGAELQSIQVKEGDKPAYTGATPTRPEDDQYTYAFSGWSPAIVAAAADADYTAQFDATEKPVTPEAITVRLEPNSATGWSNVYLYSWTGSGGTQPTGAWPGTRVSKDSEGWWAYTFDKSIRNINIIWNSGTGAQTVDITGITSSTCFTLNGTTGTKITVTVIGCNLATAMEEMNPDRHASSGTQVSSPAVKIFEDGHIFILRDGKTYTIHGQELK